MPFYLDHTIVPARDKDASAQFFARIFGLDYKGPWGPFAPVKVNDTLTLDFAEYNDPREFDSHHYAFITSDEEFDMGRGFYFRDPNGHMLEVITHSYV